jgi:hypothetical protein
MIETTINHYGHLTPSYRKEEIRKIEGRMDTCMDTGENKKDYEPRNPLKNNGAPCMIRTCGPRFRKPVLYPTELRGLMEEKILYYKREEKMKT